jgi:DnaJ-class molecular chaperone
MQLPTNLGHDDALAWQFDRKGLFSAKSAYHVLDDEKQREKIRQKGESSGNGGSQIHPGLSGANSGSSLAHRKFDILSGIWRAIAWP